LNQTSPVLEFATVARLGGQAAYTNSDGIQKARLIVTKPGSPLIHNPKETIEMPLSAGSEEVKLYLPMIQSVISRMASNSASCKTWCVTLVTALFALAIDKNKPTAILLGLFPLVLFLFLDAYYLSLERDFIALYDEFVDKLQKNTAEINDAFNLKLRNNCFLQRLQATAVSFKSLAVWPFYGIILLTLIVTFTQIKDSPGEITAKPPPASPSPTP
jgi:hypothetical protein